MMMTSTIVNKNNQRLLDLNSAEYMTEQRINRMLMTKTLHKAQKTLNTNETNCVTEKK